MNKTLLVVLLALILCVQYSYSFMFEVRAADEKCIVEEFRQDTLVNGKFEVSDRLSKNIAFQYEVVMASMQMKFYVCILLFIFTFFYLFIYFYSIFIYLL